MQQKLEKLALFLGFLGVLVSGYLVYNRLSGSEIVCGLSNCGVVNNSDYSYFLGIPVSFSGLAFYIGIIALLLIKQYRLFFYASVVGVIFSAYLTYLEAFVINAWCQWCILSAWISIALFIIAIRLRKPVSVETPVTD